MNPGFGNDSFEFERKQSSPDDRMAPPVFAEVLEILPRFRANILTQNGERFNEVRCKEPYLNGNTSYAHGRFGGLSVGQMVLVEFIGGSFRAPVITKAFSFPTKDSDFQNIRNFWNHFSFIDSESDIIDFHRSGYAVRQTDNKIQIYDSSQNIVFEIDFYQRKVSIHLDLEIQGNLRINGAINLTGNLNQTGDLDVTGKIHSSGIVNSDSDVKAGAVSLGSHGHDYNEFAPGPSTIVRTSNAVP